MSLSPAAKKWKRFPWETSSLIVLVLVGGAGTYPPIGLGSLSLATARGLFCLEEWG